MHTHTCELTHTHTHIQQISCPHDSRNYSDNKIEQFKSQIEELKTDHQKFVAKVRKLDPNYKDIIPWQPRGYSRKRPHDNHMTSSDSHVTSKKLCSPLLEKEEKLKPEQAMAETNLLGLDYSSSSEEEN